MDDFSYCYVCTISFRSGHLVLLYCYVLQSASNASKLIFLVFIRKILKKVFTAVDLLKYKKLLKALSFGSSLGLRILFATFWSVCLYD